jgi:hypothetical protein
VAPGERRAAARQKLQLHTEEVMRWALAGIAAEAAGLAAPLVAVTVRTAQDLEDDPAAVEASFAMLRRLAAEAGVPVIELGGIYGDRAADELRLS